MQTKDFATDAQTMQVVIALEQFARVLQTNCYTKDLAPAQWSALRFLSRAKPEERTQAHLAAFSGVTISSSSRTVALLKQKQLIDVRRAPHNGRQTYMEITEAGRSLLTRDPLRDLVEAVNGLKRDDKDCLLDHVTAILGHLLPSGGDAAG